MYIYRDTTKAHSTVQACWYHALAIHITASVCNIVSPVNPRETPRLHNSPVFSAAALDNKTLYLATIGHESAQHSTSLLHAAFRLLSASLIAPARATHLLAILPYRLKSFAPRGWEHFHCPLR